MTQQLPPAKLPFDVTRAVAVPAGVSGDGKFIGYFSTFDERYEVDSMLEGHFLESIKPTAFDLDWIRANAKALYDHGQDPQIGNKVLGTIDELRADAKGPAYAIGPFDTSYNRDLAPGLAAGVYGSSFRFQVLEDEWDRSGKRSTDNPEGLPTRYITKARVPEFGPVTFPANPSATAGIRSTTDTYYKRSRDPEAFEALVRSATQVRSASVTPVKPQEKVRMTDEYITREDKAARATELEQALTRQATEHPGVLPETAQATWDRDTAELNTLRADIKAWDTRTELLKSFAAGETRTESGSPTIIVRKSEADIYDMRSYGAGHVRSTEERNQKLRDNAMRSVETARFEHPAAQGQDAEIRAHMQWLIDNKDTPDKEVALRMLGTGNPVYKAAFNDAVKGNHLSPERAAALQVVGTTTTGGYAIPYTFDPTFIPTGAWTNINPFRQICRVESIAGSNKWEGVSVGAVTATYDAESAATTEGGPTFARPAMTAQRASSFVTLSRETLQDRPDMGSELAVLIGEAKDTLEENQFSIGVGSTYFPLGMFVKSTFTVKETITDNVFAVADLDATEAALPIRHRRDAVWMLSRGVIRIIQGFETAYGKYFNSTLGYPAVGNPLNNAGGNTGLNLLGYPVYETPSAPVTVTSDDTIVGILVAPKNYMILDRLGMDVEVVPNLFDATTGFPNGNRGVLAIWRNTARALNADAGRQININ